MDQTVDASPRPTPSAPIPHRSIRSTVRAHPVLAVGAGLILLQLVVRGWVATNGYFYWDDLILVGRAGRYPLLSSELLLHNQDGHFMPLAFAVAWLVTAIAPLAWGGPLVTMLVLQLAASVAVLRMLVVLLGVRWKILLPLAFYLFCPLTLPAFSWWAAALNALPLQWAMAWVIGDAVLLVRTGARRHALSGIAALVLALLFFEKSVAVPFVAFAVAVLASYVVGERSALRTVLRRGALLWAGSALVLTCWLVGYLMIDVSAVRTNGSGLRDLLHSATSLGVVPTLFGGPWAWERWLPSTPWAQPPTWTVWACWLALGLVAALTIRLRLRAWPVWLLTVAYVLGAQVPIALIRGGPDTSAELMQSLRYLADVAVVLTAAGALVLLARPRGSVRIDARVASTATVLFVISALWSTYTFGNSWSNDPTKTYLTNVKSALDEWDGAPILDQEMPWNVLNPIAFPQNLTSKVFAPYVEPGTFADWTPRLRMFTNEGRLVDAQVWWNRGIVPGPAPDCGYRVQAGQPTSLELDGPMLDHGWTSQLNYLASGEGVIDIGFDERGAPVTVPVHEGLNTVFVRLVGGGSALRVATVTPGLQLCIGTGPVGVASYQN